MSSSFAFISISVALALVPLLLGLLTSYIKISIVLGMTRSALGTQQVPSGLVIMAMSLALTYFTMAPIIEACLAHSEKIDYKTIFANPSLQAFRDSSAAFDPWRGFLETHAGKRERKALELLAQHPELPASAGPILEAKTEAEEQSKTSLRILIPAFILTELKEGFAMAFVLLLPFLVVDLIVANILVGLGMYMVSPVMIALPLKLILFVLTDGWLLLAKGLINSYQV